MDTGSQPIVQRTLIALLAAKRSQRVHACAGKSGWRIVIRNGKTDLVLVDENDAVRIFPTLQDLQDYLHSIAVPFFLTDLSALDVSANDPETLDRMREAREVVERDQWMRQQVQEALDDPGPSIPNSEVKERSAARRAELMARLTKEAS